MQEEVLISICGRRCASPIALFMASKVSRISSDASARAFASPRRACPAAAVLRSTCSLVSREFLVLSHLISKGETRLPWAHGFQPCSSSCAWDRSWLCRMPFCRGPSERSFRRAPFLGQLGVSKAWFGSSAGCCCVAMETFLVLHEVIDNLLLAVQTFRRSAHREGAVARGHPAQQCIRFPGQGCDPPFSQSKSDEKSIAPSCLASVRQNAETLHVPIWRPARR